MRWDVEVTLGATDITEQAYGRIWRRQEANAAHLCRVVLAPPAGTVLDPDAQKGAVLTVRVRLDGGAWSVRFSGVVTAPSVVAGAGAIQVEASDRLQAWFEGLADADAVLAALPGARYHSTIQGDWSDGWTVGQACMATLPYSYHIDRGGVHRWRPWAADAVADAVIDASGTYADTWDVVRPSERELLNVIVGALEVRGPVLRRWQCHGHWVLPWVSLCEYLLGPQLEEFPTMGMVSGAVGEAGMVVSSAGSLSAGESAGGINYGRMPPSGTYTCGDFVPRTWVRYEGEVISAGWIWETRWVQTLSIQWPVVVTAPDSVAAWGAAGAEDSRLYSTEADFGDWGQGLVAGLPALAWEGAPGGYRAVEIDEVGEVLMLESWLAQAMTRELAAHRATLQVGCIPSAVTLGVEIGDTVQVTAERGQWSRAVVGAIEEYWDIETGDCQVALTLRPSRCPGAGGVSDEVVAPARPDLDEAWSVETDIGFPVRVGGYADPMVSPPTMVSGRG